MGGRGVVVMAVAAGAALVLALGARPGCAQTLSSKGKRNSAEEDQRADHQSLEVGVHVGWVIKRPRRNAFA